MSAPSSPARRKPKYVTVQHAARLVRRCTATLYRWVRDGTLPNTRQVRGGYLILYADLEALTVPLAEHDPPAAD